MGNEALNWGGLSSSQLYHGNPFQLSLHILSLRSIRKRQIVDWRT